MITEVFPIRVTPSFNASTDPIFARLREASSKGGGKHQSYGMSIEDPNELWWFIHFENGLLPDDLKWDYTTYGDPKDLFGQLTSEAPANSFVHIEGSETFPTGVLDAAVTEIGILDLNQSSQLSEFSKVIEIVVAELKKAPGAKGVAWGATKPKEGSQEDVKVFILVGWDSVEDHVKLTSLEEFKQKQSAMMPFLKGARAVHVKFDEEGA